MKDQCELDADRVTHIFTKKMGQEKGLVAVGTGGGGNGKRIRMLSVTFYCYEAFDIAATRALLHECVEKFLTEINQREELERCLTVFPLTYKNVSISILFRDKATETFVLPPAIASAAADEGKVDYWTCPNNNLTLLQEEAYEE